MSIFRQWINFDHFILSKSVSNHMMILFYSFVLSQRVLQMFLQDYHLKVRISNSVSIDH